MIVTPWPRGGFPRSHKSNNHLQILVLFSVWLLNCGWKSDDRLEVAPNSLPNSFQNTEEKKGTPVGDHIQWEAMEPEAMLHQQLGRLLGQRQLLERDEVSHLTESIYDVSMTMFLSEAGQTSDKVQGDQGRQGTGSGWRSPADRVVFVDCRWNGP